MPRPARLRVIVAYVPVLHRGYLQFFEANSKFKKLYVIGPDLLKKVDYLRKDLRALPPNRAAGILTSTNMFESVTVLSARKIPELDSPSIQILMPEEDISRAIGSMFAQAKIKYYPVFLRWDRRTATAPSVKSLKELTSTRKIDKNRMGQAYIAATASPDIWRRVGALLLTEAGEQVGLTANQGEPSAHTSWIEGDPRNLLNQGVGIEISTFMHAEAALIAKAANEGIRLRGGSMYVTTFPCPLCAKLIAHSGIKALYYNEGYGVLDGRRVLEEHGVTIKRVQIDNSSIIDSPNSWVPYKKSN